jgi:hypothetical protein
MDCGPQHQATANDDPNNEKVESSMGHEAASRASRGQSGIGKIVPTDPHEPKLACGAAPISAWGRHGSALAPHLAHASLRGLHSRAPHHIDTHRQSLCIDDECLCTCTSWIASHLCASAPCIDISVHAHGGPWPGVSVHARGMCIDWPPPSLCMHPQGPAKSILKRSDVHHLCMAHRSPDMHRGPAFDGRCALSPCVCMLRNLAALNRT